MVFKPLTFLYCPMCSVHYAEDQRDLFHKHCTACGYTLYENLRTSVGALVVKDGRVLLVKRAVEPRQATWDVPGGFTEPTEHPEATVVREVQEELGVACTVNRLFGVYAPNPYPYLGKVNYACDLFYLVDLPASATLHPADDVTGFKWFPLTSLPKDAQLAFPTTRQALRDLQAVNLSKVCKPQRG